MDGSEEVARRFGANLRSCRGQTGLSQEELSFRAGLHRTAVGQLERGERVARLDTLIKLIAALGVSADCPLLDGIAWRPGHSCAGQFETTVGGSGQGSAQQRDTALVSSTTRSK